LAQAHGEEIPAFLRAPFSFVLTKKLQPPPHSSCPGPTPHRWGCSGASVQESEQGNGEARNFLEQLPWHGFPSAALVSLQMGFATDSKSWRAGSEPKRSGQVVFSFALQVLDKVSLISEKYRYEICRANEAKQSERCRICDVPFWPASFLQGFTEIQRSWQNCCNWCTLENRDAINSQTELAVEGTSEFGFFTAT